MKNRLLGQRIDKTFCHCFLLSLIVFFVQLFIYRSSIFNGLLYGSMDFYDSGMDFFNSVICTKYRNPYLVFETLYPPLANIFYYCFYCILPWEYACDIQDFFYGNRLTVTDLRLWFPTFFGFMVLLQIQSIVFLQLVKKYLTCHTLFVAIALLFSLPMMFAVERGNIIIITLLFTMYFLFNFDSEVRYRRYLAYFCLIIAIGFKLYPVLFGLFLLKRRNYKGCLILSLLSVLVVFLPFFFFNGFDDMLIWIKTLTNHGLNINLLTGKVFVGFVQTCVHLFESLLSVDEIMKYAKPMNIFLVIIVIIQFFYERLFWKELLLLGLVVCFGQGVSPYYNVIFLLPAFIAYVNEEKVLHKDNIWDFVFWVILLLPITFGVHAKLIWTLRVLAILVYSHFAAFCGLKSIWNNIVHM